MVFLFGVSFAQINNGRVASYSFNNGNAKDDVGKHNAKEVGVSFVTDRFGNERSACYLQGTYGSYLNLGTENVLKPVKGSISLWINIGLAIEAGEGYKMNPVIVTKCASSDDFFEAYAIYYDYGRNLLVAGATLSDLNQVGVASNFTPDLHKWYHIVITYDDDWFTLYINGNFENKLKKGFTTKFLAGDSVMVGNSANTKNKRFFNGSVDDIIIFDKVISEKEVKELYDAPNPNKYSTMMKWIAYLISAIVLVVIIVMFFSIRYKRIFEKEMEKNLLQNKIYELEIKWIFRSNSPLKIAQYSPLTLKDHYSLI